MKKEKLIAELADLGIEVKDGKIRKSDIFRILASKLDWAKIDQAIEGTDFADVHSDAGLKKIFEDHADLLSSLDPDRLTVLLGGDYHSGYESHSFPNEHVADVKSFVKDVGKHLGWDPESYLDPETDCMECQKDLEHCECEICEECNEPLSQCSCDS